MSEGLHVKNSTLVLKCVCRLFTARVEHLIPTVAVCLMTLNQIILGWHVPLLSSVTGLNVTLAASPPLPHTHQGTHPQDPEMFHLHLLVGGWTLTQVQAASSAFCVAAQPHQGC